ncbi:MAG: hypothetical protein NC401_12215 [Ruminococcus sp.]|nr:hypothetical protein [Ruminococcus sp.]
MKKRAAAMCRRAGNYDVADKIDACDIFSGDETLPELIDKIFTPQGREFMTSFGFPDIETFRRFIPYHPEQYGVFIDASEIAITDVSRVCLIGNTSARLNYAKTQGNTVILMHGANADIIAAGYSVVKVELGAQCRYHADKRDNAIVNG